MLEHHYYYVIAGLPELFLDDEKKLPLSLGSFREVLSAQLDPQDLFYFRYLLHPFDNQNVLSLVGFLKKGDLLHFGSENPFSELEKLTPLEVDCSWNPSGLFSKEGLMEQIQTGAGLPGWIVAFLERFRVEEEQTSPSWQRLWEKELTGLFLQEVLQCPNQFIRSWYGFDKDLRNIILAMNGRYFGLDATDEYIIIGDDEIVEQLGKSKAPDFGLGGLVPYIERLGHLYETATTLSREKGIDLLRWEMIDEMNKFDYFNVERLMGYWCKLEIVTRWFHLSEETGQEMFQRIINEIESEFRFPEEFTLTGGK